MEEITCTTRLNTLCSELSPEMLNICHFAPKASQVYWGGAAPKGKRVHCVDAVGCRENAIVDNDDALPVFSPMDEPEPFRDANNNVKHDPMYYDYLYVDVPDGDEAGRFPYTGRRFYWKGAVRYMLENGRVDARHIKAGIRATKHVSPSALNDAFKTIKALWAHVVQSSWAYRYYQPEEIPEGEVVRGQKGAILSCIGLWNSTEQSVCKKVKSLHESDASEATTRAQRRRLRVRLVCGLGWPPVNMADRPDSPRHGASARRRDP